MRGCVRGCEFDSACYGQALWGALYDKDRYAGLPGCLLCLVPHIWLCA